MEKSIPPSVGNIGRITTDNQTGKNIKAICNNCNKRSKSMRAITMHLKMTGVRHHVNFIDYGNYNKNTGMLDKPKSNSKPNAIEITHLLTGQIGITDRPRYIYPSAARANVAA